MTMISDDGANQVLSQLTECGYLGDHDIRMQGDDDCGQDDSFETYQNWQNDTSRSSRVSEWQLIPTQANENASRHYFTPKGFIREIFRRLRQKERTGRESLSDLCRECQVDSGRIFSTTSVSRSEGGPLSSSLWNHLVEDAKASSITILGNIESGTIQGVELVSLKYWETSFEKVASIVDEQKSVSVSEIMNLYSLSRDVTLNHLLVYVGKSDRSKNINNGLRLMDDSKLLVSESYCRSLQIRVLEHFARLKEPTQINDVCQEQGWDRNQVLQWLKTRLEDQRHANGDKIDGNVTTQHELEDFKTSDVLLEGEIHIDAAMSGQTAMYLPISYRERQRQEILEFVNSNGYITLERALKNYRKGFPAAQISIIVQEAFPDIIVLNDGDTFISDSILQQVKVEVDDYLLSASTCELLDLQEYLPAELIQSPTTMLSVFKCIGFNSPSDGIVVVGNDRTIVVSYKVVQHLKAEHLSPHIQEYAKNRAKQLFQIEITSDNNDDEEEEDTERSKSGRKSRKSARSKRCNKSSKKKNKISKSDVSGDIVSLSIIVSSIIDACPIFQEDSLSLDESEQKNLKWEDDDDNGCNSNLAAQFCRKAFYSEILFEQCKSAVDTELRRLQSEKKSKAKRHLKDANSKRSVESAFQDAFIVLCHLIQAQSKAIVSFANTAEDCIDEQSLEKMKDEFLQGPCADLTSRITQHCLFQEESEEDLFTFAHPTQQKQDDSICNTGNANKEMPLHCTDVTITARRYPQSYLSCPPPREPLPILRESFSGNTGIVLSRMWILCGGECYRGGVRTIEDDEEGVISKSVHVRPGNMDAFLSYAEENCLTLCGLPYKKLDKKNEKKILFSRKQQLIALLDKTEEATDVLEYTIMILFQQIKNILVCGSMLRGPILGILLKERKIPPSVALAMRLLNEMILQDNDQTVDQKLVLLVKECGIVRDISKYDTTPLEAFLVDYQSGI